MAQILTVKTANVDCSVNDVIGIYPDSHIFSEHEISIFNVIQTENTLETENELLNAVAPESSSYVHPVQFIDGEYIVKT